MARKTPPEPWRLEFFQRHPDDDPDRSVPARDFFDSCPPKVAQEMQAVLAAVAAAPPPAFSGGGKWEAMHGDMAGIYEVRAQGPDGRLYRLFCILERDGEGLQGPSVVVITGLAKKKRTVIPLSDYRKVRRLRDEFAERRTVLG